MHTDKEFLEIINNSLDKINFGEKPDRLYDPVYYSLKVGGKRIRPVLCLMATEMFGAKYSDGISVAIGIEIFHNFTLLHDDIMDKADIRRGHPVVHKKWNENIAILSGDAMSVIAYKYISESKNIKPVLDVFSDTALKICEGQQYDMDFETENDVSVKDYLKMIDLKTAVLLAASLKIGAIVANAPKTDQNNIYKFGQNLGMAFQLQDDYLDTFGNPKKFGKNIGGDIVANKKTYLLIKALEIANKDTLTQLKKWISVKNFNHEEKINAVRNIYKELNIEKHSTSLIESYIKNSEKYLNAINLNPERTQLLKTFTDSLRFRAI